MRSSNKHPSNQPTKMKQLKISHLKFDPSRMVRSIVDSKKSEPKKNPDNPEAKAESVSYQVMSLEYEYDVVDENGNVSRVVGPLCVEGPEVYSPTGIQLKIGQSGREQASLFVQFDTTQSEVAQCVSVGTDEKGTDAGFFHKLHMWGVERLHDMKDYIPSFRAFKKTGIEAVLGYPIYRKDPSSRPSKYFNLIHSGKMAKSPTEPAAFGRKETIFNLPYLDPVDPGTPENPNYAKIPWYYLTNGVELRGRPLILFERIYIGGGKASFQFKIISMAVSYCVPINSVSQQSDTLSKMAQDAKIVQAVREQVNALARAFADSFTVRDSKPNDEKDTKQESKQESKQDVKSNKEPEASPPPQLPVPAETTSGSSNRLPAPSASPGLAAQLSSGPTIAQFAGMMPLPGVQLAPGMGLPGVRQPN